MKTNIFQYFIQSIIYRQIISYQTYLKFKQNNRKNGKMEYNLMTNVCLEKMNLFDFERIARINASTKPTKMPYNLVRLE